MHSPAKNSQQHLELQEFWCKRATVFFLYSFSLAPKDNFGGYVLNPTSLENIITSKPCIHVGVPECRQGILPHLDFKPDCAYIDYPSVTARMGEYIEVEVGKLMRLFRTAGTCTIRITMKPPPERYLKTKDILHALGLVGRLTRNSTPDPRQIYMLTMEDESLKRIYDIFRETVEDLCDRSENHLKWLDKEFQFIDPSNEVQSPFVVTVAEVEKEVAETFCEGGETGEDDPARLKMLRIRPYERHLAPILYRTLGPEDPANWLRLEPSYVDPSIPGGIPGLFNQNIDSRLYSHFSRRSILCICRDRKKDPASFLLPDILSVCELVRSRWHMLIMMNKKFDHSLQETRDQLYEYMTQEESHFEREDQVKKLMKLRSWLYASYEDPGTYMIAGDAMSKLYEHMQTSFRIDELRDNVQGKLSLLDRLLNDFEEYDWLRSSSVRRYGTRPTAEKGKESS